MKDQLSSVRNIRFSHPFRFNNVVRVNRNYSKFGSTYGLFLSKLEALSNELFAASCFRAINKYTVMAVETAVSRIIEFLKQVFCHTQFNQS